MTIYRRSSTLLRLKFRAIDQLPNRRSRVHKSKGEKRLAINSIAGNLGVGRGVRATRYIVNLYRSLKLSGKYATLYEVLYKVSYKV